MTREERREYHRLWIKARRESYFKDKCCAVCKSIENLELDHIDPSLKVSHNIWSWSEIRRLAELEKCQPLCRVCHRLKTNIQISKPITHGKYSSYKKRGCRCELCYSAHVDYRKTLPSRKGKRV